MLTRRSAIQHALAPLASLVAGGLTLMGTPAAQAQIRDIGSAVERADRERMLIQRMGKAYLAVGQGVLAAQAKQVLSDSMSQFDRTLIELRAFAPNPAVQTVFNQLARDWDEYKILLVGKDPSKTEAPKVVSAASKVLATANRAELQLVALSGKPTAQLIATAGEQRVHTQAMAKFYLAAAWGLDAAGATREIGRARAQYLGAHTTLLQAPDTTPAIQAELRQAETQFTFLDAGLQAARPQEASPEMLRNLFTASERVLQVMDNVAQQYARLLR